jgi:hypothetical protein
MPNSAPARLSPTRTIARSYARRPDEVECGGGGNACQAVIVATLPGEGTFLDESNGSLGGGRTAIVAGQTITTADILAGKLTFRGP